MYANRTCHSIGRSFKIRQSPIDRRFDTTSSPYGRDTWPIESPSLYLHRRTSVSKVQLCGGCSTAANSHDTFTGKASPEPNRDIQGNPQVMQTYNPPVSVRSSQKEKGGKHGNRNGEWRTGRGIGKRADGEDSQRQRDNTTKQEAQEFEGKNRLLKGNKYLSIPA